MRRAADVETGRGGNGGSLPLRFRPAAALLALAVPACLVFALCRPAPRAAEPRVVTPRTVPAHQAEAFLDKLERETFQWFWDLADPGTRLIPDRAPTPSFSSVAAVGFGLTAYTVGAERGWVTRGQAAWRTAETLRFLVQAPQGEAPRGMTAYRGFFYHFLDMKTGERYESTELSTIDTTLLAAGALSSQSYFDGQDPVEAQIRDDADTLYRRIEWTWAQPRPPGVSMGWTPEEGFHNWNWSGYDEAMILYLLALGSPTHPIDPAAWPQWCSTYVWGPFYGQEHVNFSPLFGHQYSHLWADFRGIQDAYMRGKGIDYFENSRRATISQRAYAGANPAGWEGYGANVWGLTACDGPLDGTLVIDGRLRSFMGYAARGASLRHVIDDGTIAPAAAAGSIAFAPEIVVPALQEMTRRWPDLRNQYGFLDAFNPTFANATAQTQNGRLVQGVGWFDVDQLGIDQGPIVAMIENYRSGLVWRTMRKNPYVVAGLKRAGFTGGWLDTPAR
ncbi:MAG: glucoamylase family protein [Thermoanaerobaculia bacterium]